MALFQFFDFLKAAAGYIKPDDEALEEAGGIESPAVSYHKRVVIASALCGVIVAIAGTVGALMEPVGGKGETVKMILLGPPVFGVGGIVLGVAGACLVAPRAFLTGPVGRKWMALIGTKSVLVARIVCGILAMIILGAVIALTVKAAMGK